MKEFKVGDLIILERPEQGSAFRNRIKKGTIGIVAKCCVDENYLKENRNYVGIFANNKLLYPYAPFSSKMGYFNYHSFNGDFLGRKIWKRLEID